MGEGKCVEELTAANVALWEGSAKQQELVSRLKGSSAGSTADMVQSWAGCRSDNQQLQGIERNFVPSWEDPAALKHQLLRAENKVEMLEKMRLDDTRRITQLELELERLR